MKQPQKILGPAAIIVLAAVVVGGLYYHHYQYQPIVHHLSDGSSVTISRHNLDKLTPAQQHAMLHPINENALHPCTGNAQDQCLASSSVDFWPSGSEGASNPDLQKPTNANTVPIEIMGRIAAITGNNLQIKTTSGRIFTIEYPINTITNFNTNLAGGYGFTVGLGDELYVTYYQASNKATTITTPQIFASSIIIKTNGKEGPISKY